MVTTILYQTYVCIAREFDIFFILSMHNDNLAKHGVFAVRDTDVVLGSAPTTIPMTRISVNTDNFYTVNADGTITIPPGTYMITATIHGVHVTNDFLSFCLSCAGKVFRDMRHQTVTEQTYRCISMLAKSSSSMNLRVYGISSLGTSHVYGYLAATDTIVMVQKIA